MSVQVCVFTYACFPCHQIPPLLPSNNCSHSVFEHKHTLLSLCLQLSVCACLLVCDRTHMTPWSPLMLRWRVWPLLSVISVKAAIGGPFHFQRKNVTRLCERMAGFPCERGSGPISPRSNWRVLTKHSRSCVFIVFPYCLSPTFLTEKTEITPEYLAKVKHHAWVMALWFAALQSS